MTLESHNVKKKKKNSFHSSVTKPNEGIHNIQSRKLRYNKQPTRNQGKTWKLHDLFQFCIWLVKRAARVFFLTNQRAARVFFWPITERNVVKPILSWITFSKVVTWLNLGYSRAAIVLIQIREIMQRCIGDFDNTNNKLIVPKGNLKKFPFQERPANRRKQYLLRFWRRGAGLNELKSSMALFLITTVKGWEKYFKGWVK